MQGFLGKPRVSPSPLFVFDTQPLAKPSARMLFYGSVGLADRPQTEVVSPTIDLPVERTYQRCRILLGLTPAGHLADRLANTLHSFLGRSGTPVGPPRLRRVASTKRIPKKIELLFRQSTDPRLTFVHRQLQPRHHAPHRHQCLIGSGATADHQSSSGGESHPSALTEPDVKLSPHPAPTIQPPASHQAATEQTAWGPVARCAPASASMHVLDADSTVGFAAFVGEGQSVLPVHLVVQSVETKARRFLRFHVQRRLQLLNTCGGC